MKKQVVKKLVAGVLASAMAVSMFVGCTPATTEDPTTKGNEPGTTTEAPTVEVKPDAGIKGWTKFDNEVTIKIPVYDRGEDGDETSNYWTEWVNENFGKQYNVKVEYVAIGRGTVLDDYNNLANAKNLPTVLMEYDFDKCAYWANDGFLRELDLEAFANVAPTYYQSMVDNNYLQFTSLNGKTYFALAERPYSDTNYQFVTFYRKDWLDQLGLEYPVTWQEWLDTYKAIKDAGLCDYPAGGSEIVGAGVDQNYNYRTYPQDELAWATTGDYAIPALSTDAQKTLLQRRNQLYNLKYLNPEFATKKAADADADFVAGKSFAYSVYIAPDIAVVTDFYAQNPDATLGIAPVTTVTDDGDGAIPCAYRVNNSYGMMIGFSATATDDEVKAAQMYMEWLVQPENLFTFQYGFEGDTFNYDDNGLPQLVNFAEYTGEHAMVARSNKDYFCIVIEARKLDSIEKTVTASYPASYKDSAAFYDQIVANYYAYKDVIAKTPMYAVTDCKFAKTLEQAASLQEYLLTQYSTYATTLTTVAEDQFEATYADLSQKYLNDGYQTVIDERKALYEGGFTSSLPQY